MSRHSFLIASYISYQDGRVVKALDLSSNGRVVRVGSNPTPDIFLQTCKLFHIFPMSLNLKLSTEGFHRTRACRQFKKNLLNMLFFIRSYFFFIIRVIKPSAKDLHLLRATLPATTVINRVLTSGRRT